MKNLLKEKLQQNQSVIGTFIQMGHPDITEYMAGLGFDWLPHLYKSTDYRATKRFKL